MRVMVDRGGDTMNGIPFAAVVPVVVLALAWIGWCWWDIARGPVRHLPKWAWALISALSVPVGGIIYLVAGREPR
jgi:hypothetical protein